MSQRGAGEQDKNLAERVFPGSSSMSAMCRSHDWAATPLGPVDHWPRSLQTAAAIVLGSSFPMVIIWGPERIQIYNDACVHIIDTGHPHALGASIHSTWPSLRERHEAIFARVDAGEQVKLTDARYRLDRSDAHTEANRFFDASFAAVSLEDGGRGGWLVTLHETTARVQAGQAEAERERLLIELAVERERMLEAQSVTKAGSWETDLPTMQVRWSAETFRLFGLDPATFTPTHEAFLDHIHPQDRARVDVAFHASFSTRDVSTVEHRVVLANGTIKHVEERWKTMVDSSGTATRAVGTCQDITQRSAADAERRELTAALEMLTDDAVSIWDEVGHIRYANGAHARLFGYDQTDFAAVALDALMPDDAAREELRLARADVRQGKSWSGTVRRRRISDGLVVSFDLTLGPIPNSEQTHYFAIARDATARLAREQHLRRVERVAGMGTLIAGVAHELNNPLSAILGFTQLLLLEPRSTEERDDLATIAQEAQRMAKIVSDLRLVARDTQADTKLARVALNDVVHHVLKTRAYALTTHNIEVRPDLADDLPDLWADRAQVEQVLLNLVVNAEQAMAAMHSGERRLIVRTRASATGCTLSVVDTGPGIPRDDLEHIFDPFFTTKVPGEGTGLGLSLVQSIIADHHGEIHVESKIGAGSAFRIDLLRAPDVVGEALKSAAPAPPARRLRVLVVDDEESVRGVVVRLLTRRGHDVVEASDGGQALMLLQASKASYDVIVSDLRMPGLGGDGLLERLQARGDGMAHRLIFLTGDTASPDARRMLAGAHVPILTKPAGLAELVQLVEQTGAQMTGEHA